MDELENKQTETTETVEVEQNVEVDAEIKRLKAELAKQISKNDTLAKENAEQKKAIRARQSAEEIAAEEKRAQDEARDKELADLRKRFAVAETSKRVMGFVGDEASSTQIAEFLYGAEDVDGVVDVLSKAWMAKEKKLRLEYGKIPAPGVGGADGPTITKEQLDNMKFTERVKFANEHPDEYNKLMGR